MGAGAKGTAADEEDEVAKLDTRARRARDDGRAAASVEAAGAATELDTGVDTREAVVDAGEGDIAIVVFALLLLSSLLLLWLAAFSTPLLSGSTGGGSDGPAALGAAGGEDGEAAAEGARGGAADVEAAVVGAVAGEFIEGCSKEL